MENGALLMITVLKPLSINQILLLLKSDFLISIQGKSETLFYLFCLIISFIILISSY